MPSHPVVSRNIIHLNAQILSQGIFWELSRHLHYFWTNMTNVTELLGMQGFYYHISTTGISIDTEGFLSDSPCDNIIVKTASNQWFTTPLCGWVGDITIVENEVGDIPSVGHKKSQMSVIVPGSHTYILYDIPAPA